jgi:glycosyltransferase involved in cell wall biosynthesis
MYLMDGFDYAQGGTEGQVVQLIKYLDRSRYDPYITFLRPSEYIATNGFVCRVFVLNLWKLASVSTFGKFLWFGWHLRSNGYRLVHCFFNDVSIIAPPLLQLFGLRILVSRRDMGFWYSPLRLTLLRLVSRCVSRFIVNSSAVKHVVHEGEWVPEENISVIYNGYVEGEKSAAAGGEQIDGLVKGGPIIGVVANLSRIKRLDVLVRAFAALSSRHQEANLVIVGDYQQEEARAIFEELNCLALQLGVQRLVTFTGSVVDSFRYINLFTVAVLCSESEGFSNSIIEYMQAGKPIVCTDTGGNPELIEDGVTGFLVPVGDVDALAKRIEMLLLDRELAQRLGERARVSARAYSHVRMVDEHMALYDVVLSGRGALHSKALLGVNPLC